MGTPRKRVCTVVTWGSCSECYCLLAASPDLSSRPLSFLLLLIIITLMIIISSRSIFAFSRSHRTDILVFIQESIVVFFYPVCSNLSLLTCRLVLSFFPSSSSSSVWWSSYHAVRYCFDIASILLPEDLIVPTSLYWYKNPSSSSFTQSVRTSSATCARCPVFLHHIISLVWYVWPKKRWTTTSIVRMRLAISDHLKRDTLGSIRSCQWKNLQERIEYTAKDGTSHWTLEKGLNRPSG